MALVDKFNGKYSGEIVLSLSISIKPYTCTQPLQSILSLLETASQDCTNVGGDLNTAFLCSSFGAAVMRVFGSSETLDVAEKEAASEFERVDRARPSHVHPANDSATGVLESHTCNSSKRRS